jgi:hypothetical protein
LPAALPGLMLLGAEDPMNDAIRGAAELLTPLGVRVDVVEGLGHAEPADLADRLVAELGRLAAEPDRAGS